MRFLWSIALFVTTAVLFVLSVYMITHKPITMATGSVVSIFLMFLLQLVNVGLNERLNARENEPKNERERES